MEILENDHKLFRNKMFRLMFIINGSFYYVNQYITNLIQILCFYSLLLYYNIKNKHNLSYYFIKQS